MTENETQQRGRPKFQEGVVVSNKMQKTIVVGVTTKKQHPMYGKFVTVTKKFVAHDENNSCGIGDTVRIVETRPLSRTKRWKVSEIMEKATVDELKEGV